MTLRLAGFDRSDSGDFHIGLIGGPLESAREIGDFFEMLARGVAERAIRGAPPVTNLPVDYDFVQKMVNQLVNQVAWQNLDEEADACDVGDELLSDCNFGSQACDCLEEMLEYVGLPVVRSYSFLDGECCSSHSEVWYCEDAKKAVGEIDKAIGDLCVVIEPYMNLPD